MLLGPSFLAPVLSRYFLRPSYRLTVESARASWGTGQTEMRWDAVRRATFDKRAVHLSPLAGTGVRQSFRGVELQLPASEPECASIVAYVRDRLPPEVVYDRSDDERSA